ncbi:condensation domain-containing protein [Streptomyces sp. NPDC046909]|uniref:condensation domain-containing protein n=1 Tax=Streptomyces sp. NPDC046909 TaxID=3155617 RepID=UPI003409D8A2
MTGTRTVAFHGDRSGRCGLTWGQKWIWRAVHSQAPELRHLNMSRTVAVPEGRDLETVLAGLATITARHEGLRTRFSVDETGTPCQTFARAGELPVQIVDAAGEDPEAVAGQTLARLESLPFTVAELSLRAAVVTYGGVPSYVVLTAFHMAVDHRGLAMVAEDLAAELDGSAPGTFTHPLDRVAHEHSAEGRRASADSLRFWERELSRFPADMLPAPPAPPAEPRFQEVALRSRALHTAVRALAARYHVADAAVVLAFVAVLLAHRHGHRSCGFLLFSHNRFHEAARASATVVQNAPLCLDVQDRPLRRLLADAHRRSAVAALAGQYDPDDLKAPPPDGPDLSCALNLNFPGHRPEPTDRDIERVDALRAETRTIDRGGIDHDDMRFYLTAFHDSHHTELTLRADTSVLPAPEIHTFLRSLETAVITALHRAPDEVPEVPGRTSPESAYS